MAKIIKASASCPALGPNVTYPASIRGQWVVVHENLTSTAETAAVLRRPATYAGAGVHPLEIMGGTRILLRARMLTGISAVATSPIIWPYAVWAPPASVNNDTGVFLDDGTVHFARIDTGTSVGAGLTFTMTTSAADDRLRDTTYRYSEIYDITGTDLLTASHLLCLTATAGSVTGSAAVELMALVMN